MNDIKLTSDKIGIEAVNVQRKKYYKTLSSYHSHFTFHPSILLPF